MIKLQRTKEGKRACLPVWPHNSESCIALLPSFFCIGLLTIPIFEGTNLSINLLTSNPGAASSFQALVERACNLEGECKITESLMPPDTGSTACRLSASKNTHSLVGSSQVPPRHSLSTVQVREHLLEQVLDHQDHIPRSFPLMLQETILLSPNSCCLEGRTCPYAT